jgi:hypothetical protein
MVPETNRNTDASSSERGSALLLALMVALVLVFLGMGLLLQTSLGLEAAGTDRWVVKSLYAADAGAMFQIQMIRLEDISQPGSLQLTDGLWPGTYGQAWLLQGDFNVAIEDFCETQPATPVVQEVNGQLVVSQFPEFQTRHFHFRSESERAVGGLAGLTRAAVELDLSSWPFREESFVPVQSCY